MLLVGVISSTTAIHASILVFVAALAEEIAGLTTTQVSFVLSIAAIFEITTAASSGLVFDLNTVRSHRLPAFSLCGLTCGFALLALTFCSEINSFALIYIVLVMLIWVIYGQHATCISDILKNVNVPGGFAINRCLNGIAAMLLPLLAGQIKDRINSFQYAFTVLALLQILLSLAFFISLFINRVKICCCARGNRNNADENEDRSQKSC